MEFYIGQLGQRFIIVGDFNAHSPVLDDKTQISNYTGRTIENLILNNNICLLNPKNLYTFVCTATYKRSCLDLCFSSANLASGIEVELGRDVGSDHLPVLTNIQLRPMKTEISFRRRWKTSPENLNLFAADICESTLVKPAAIDQILNDLVVRICNSAHRNIGQTSGKVGSTVGGMMIVTRQ